MSEFEREALGIGQRWVSACNRYLFSILALKRLALNGSLRGLIRSDITCVARELVDLEDQLRALGLHPTLSLGAEAGMIWSATKSYLFSIPWESPPAESQWDELSDELAQAQQAWHTFEAAVVDLDEQLLLASPVLERWACQAKGIQHFLGLQQQARIGLDRQEKPIGQSVNECFVLNGSARMDSMI